MISILVPTLGRSDRLLEVAKNIHEATTSPHEVIFIYEVDDRDTANVLAYEYLRSAPNLHTKNYAGAIQSGYNAAIGSLLFLAADDLDFSLDWDAPVLELIAQEGVEVVGTNDLHNQGVLEGWHATHYMVTRTYIRDVGGVVDVGPGSINHFGYDHNYVDTEFIETASKRGVFKPCLGSVVEHRHFVFGLATKDETYQKGYAKLSEDAALFESRRPLWQKLECPR